MVGKGKAISHGKQAIGYAMEKSESQLIDRRFCYGEDAGQISREFSVYQAHYPNVQNNVLRFEISPQAKASQHFTPKDWKNIGESFLKEMDLERHQCVMILHKDTATPHLHVLVNRVNVDRELASDSFIGKKSTLATERIAKAMNLETAKEVQQAKARGSKAVKQEIRSIFKDIKTVDIWNFSDYMAAMQKGGVTIHPTINKKGELQGYRVEYKGYNFKASEISKEMSGVVQKHMLPKEALQSVTHRELPRHTSNFVAGKIGKSTGDKIGNRILSASLQRALSVIPVANIFRTAQMAKDIHQSLSMCRSLGGR